MPNDHTASTGLHLVSTAENAAEIEAVASLLAEHGGGRVGLAPVLADLSLRARRTWAPTPRLLGRAVRRALTWEAADRRDPLWWPQGITSSLRTGVERDLLAVSWYHKGGHGCRVSFLDPATRRYQHVLLAVPTMADGRPALTPLGVHAGGIVWHGAHLHVAATSRGFYTFRLDDLLEVPAGAPLETFGHRWVLPVRLAYQAVTDPGIVKMRYSFLTLDRTTEPPELLAGEYGAPEQTHRFARFPTDDTTGLLITEADGAARPTLLDGGEPRMQGAAVMGGSYYVTRSRGPWKPGSVYVGQPGRFRSMGAATPMGPEDLVAWPSTGLIWSVSEHPRRRWVFALSRAALDRGAR